MIPVVDVVLTFFLSGVAIAERGTWIGWVLTLFVMWQTIAIIKVIRET